MDLDEAEATDEVGISGVEEPGDNDRGVKLVVELADTTNNED